MNRRRIRAAHRRAEERRRGAITLLAESPGGMPPVPSLGVGIGTLVFLELDGLAVRVSPPPSNPGLYFAPTEAALRIVEQLGEPRRYPRTKCLVPFCRRTTVQHPHEWICPEHWQFVDRELRRGRAKLMRRIRLLARHGQIDDEVWDRVRTGAIERALGL